MPLQKNKIPISFAQGVDTKTDRKQVLPGKLLVLENGVFQTTNSLIKRNGYAALSKATTDGDTIAASIGLATFKDTLFSLSSIASFIPGNPNEGPYGYSYSPSTSKWSRVKGSYVPVNVSRSAASTSFSTTGNTSTAADSFVDTTTNLQFLAYLKVRPADGVNCIYYSFKDITTNSFISSDIQIGSGTNITVISQFFRTVKVGTKFLLIFNGTYSGVAGLYYVAIDSGNLSVQSAPVLIKAEGTTAGLFYGGSRFDAITDNGIIYIAYADGVSGSFTMNVLTISSTLVISAAQAATGINASRGTSLVADTAHNIWAAGNSGLIVKAKGYTSNLAGTYFPVATLYTSATAIYDVVGIISPSSQTLCTFFVTDSAGANVYTDPAFIVKINAQYSAGTVTGSGSTLIRNASIYSKPFTHLNKTYLIINSYDGASIQSYFILDTVTATYGQAVAKLCAQSGCTMLGNAASVYAQSNGELSTALIERTTANASKALVAWSYVISFDHKPVFAEMANTLHVSGGFVYAYDGKQLCEHNFLQAPSIATTVDSGAGFTPAGTYYYIYTYEWVDSFGQTYISAPSSPSAALTVAASRTITVTIPMLQLTNRSDGIFIGIYRSSDGINFYKLETSGYNGAFVNTPGTPTITFVDSSGNYTGQPLLYTAGGVVENVDPGATKYLATYNQRLVAIPQEANNTWWYSKEIIPAAPGAAGSPVEFSDSFISSVDERGGSIVGIQQIDEKLVFFKNANIFALSGNGPAPNGTGNDFNPPQVIATDSGCIDGQSIVLGPSGVIYKSAKGLYLIDRSMSVSYIGAPVEAYNSQEILSADLIYNLNQFRFGLSSGVVLTYNYLFDQWSVFTNHAVVQACIYQNKYTYCKADGTTLQETPGAYSDAGTSISMKLTTGWLSFADLQGYQRLYKLLLLGEYKSPHKLQVDICVDFNDAIVQTTTITAINDPLYQYRIFLSRQKCQSMKFTIQDIAPDVGTLAEGYSISAMAFEMGVKQGINKLPAARSVG
jgi:hypothetical protein